MGCRDGQRFRLQAESHVIQQQHTATAVSGINPLNRVRILQ